MLPSLIGILVAAGPLLRGSWDLWAQSLLFLALTVGSALWLAGRVLIGYVPLPSTRVLAWCGALLLLGSLSAHLSALPAFAAAAWRCWAAALWIFLALSAVSKDQRGAIDEAIRACGWILVMLAFYQYFRENMERPAASLLNQNVFAGTLLLLIPLAAQKRDWLLLLGLVTALAWTRSVGAWLGLSAALVFSRRRAGAGAYWIGIAMGSLCAIAIYGKFQSPEVLHRWQWWLAAGKMALAHPWLGTGAGTFAYLLPAYQRAGDFSSLYAHQHALETAAEHGLLFTLLWLTGILHCLRFGGPHKRFGALAILVQSLWDYSLSIPANLWLFSYFAASTISESSRGINVASRYKLPACLLVLGIGSGLGAVVWGQWKAQRLRVQALDALASDAAPAAASLLDDSEFLAGDPETSRLSAEAALRAPEPPSSPNGRLLTAAAHLERSASLNPYRATTWLGLERLYLRLDRRALALDKKKTGAFYCPTLKEGL